MLMADGYIEKRVVGKRKEEGKKRKKERKEMV